GPELVACQEECRRHVRDVGAACGEVERLVEVEPAEPEKPLQPQVSTIEETEDGIRFSALEPRRGGEDGPAGEQRRGRGQSRRRFATRVDVEKGDGQRRLAR